MKKRAGISFRGFDSVVAAMDAVLKDLNEFVPTVSKFVFLARKFSLARGEADTPGTALESMSIMVAELAKLDLVKLKGMCCTGSFLAERAEKTQEQLSVIRRLDQQLQDSIQKLEVRLAHAKDLQDEVGRLEAQPAPLLPDVWTLSVQEEEAPLDVLPLLRSTAEPVQEEPKRRSKAKMK